MTTIPVPVILIMLPLVGFAVGFASQRLDKRSVLGILITLALAFASVMMTSSRLGRIDFVNTVLPPVLAIGAFLFGLVLRRFLLASRRRW